MVGRIGQDQFQDYAARKGMTIKEAERWLAPISATFQVGFEWVSASPERRSRA